MLSTWQRTALPDAVRAPRSTRLAIRDASHDAGGIAEALACLDPQTPLEALTARAAS